MPLPSMYLMVSLPCAVVRTQVKSMPAASTNINPQALIGWLQALISQSPRKICTRCKRRTQMPEVQACSVIQPAADLRS